MSDLGKTESVNGPTFLREMTVDVPALARGCPELCEGCGEPKLYRSKEMSSLIGCASCLRSLPRWMTEARNTASAESRDLGMVWENRIALALCWMREARR